ncbi:MAG: sugar ABC transporter substrate-binding protein [Candidatus Firestonebacteria bacterium]
MEILKTIFCFLLLMQFSINAYSEIALTFTAWDYEMVGEKDFYEQLIKDFESANPDIKIQFELRSWEAAYSQIGEWIKAGKGSDLFIIPDIWMPEYISCIEPYEKYFDKNKTAEFFPVFFQRSMYEGKLIGLVWAASTKALFYRTDLFESANLKPPATWQELLGTALSLNDPPRVYGIGLPGKSVNDTASNFYLFFWSVGGEFFDANKKCIINTTVGIKALQFYVDLVNRYHITQPEVTSWSKNELQRLFEQGRLAMLETGPWAMDSIKKNSPDLKFSVTSLPRENVQVTEIVTDNIVILNSSANKDACAKFIDFAYQDKYRLAFAKLGMVPEKITVSNDDFFQKDAKWKVFVDMISSARSTPLMQWDKIESAISNAIYDALTGRKTPKQALDDVANEIDKIVAKPQ